MVTAEAGGVEVLDHEVRTLLLLELGSVGHRRADVTPYAVKIGRRVRRLQSTPYTRDEEPHPGRQLLVQGRVQDVLDDLTDESGDVAGDGLGVEELVLHGIAQLAPRGTGEELPDGLDGGHRGRPSLRSDGSKGGGKLLAELGEPVLAVDQLRFDQSPFAASGQVALRGGGGDALLPLPGLSELVDELRSRQ